MRLAESARGRAKSGLSKDRRATKSRGDAGIAGCIRGRPRAGYRGRIVTVHNFPGIGRSRRSARDNRVGRAAGIVLSLVVTTRLGSGRSSCRPP